MSYTPGMPALPCDLRFWCKFPVLVIGAGLRAFGVALAPAGTTATVSLRKKLP